MTLSSWPAQSTSRKLVCFSYKRNLIFISKTQTGFCDTSYLSGVNISSKTKWWSLALGCGHRFKFAFRNEFPSDPRKFGRKRETESKFGRGTESVFSQAINHRNWIRSSQIEGQKASYRSISRHWLTWIPFVTHWVALLILSAPLTMQALSMKTCATVLEDSG